MIARTAAITGDEVVSKSYRHPDVARLKSQPRVEPLRIDAGAMRQQFDQRATLRARFGNGPLHDFFSDAAAAAMRGDANILDQHARGALRAQSGQDAELQAAYDGAVFIFRDHELDMGRLF